MNPAQLQENNLSSDDLLQLLEKMRLNDFNTILLDTLRKHKVSFQPEVKSLRRWRRKIKEWINSSEKPETRGHGLVRQGKLDQFKQLLIPELRKMTTRNLVLLKKIVYQIFTLLDQSVPPKACSKYWWYCFLERNPEVKEIWEALPKRTCKKYDFEDLSDFDSEPNKESPAQIEKEQPFDEEENQEMAHTDVKIHIKPFELENIWEEKEPFWNETQEGSLASSTLLNYTFNPLDFYDERRMGWSETNKLREQDSLTMGDCIPTKFLQDHWGKNKKGIVAFFEETLMMEPQSVDNISIFQDEIEIKEF